jgi:gliding motility-associated-like protein
MIFTITDPICNGGSDGSAICNPSGGTPPYSYLWSDGLGSTQNAIGISAGQIYYVSVSDAIGSQEVGTVFVNDPSAFQINTTVIDSEFGVSNGTVSGNVVGGTYPYEYLWSTGDTVATIVGLISDNYYLTVTDADGCVQEVSVYVSENAKRYLRIPNAFTPNGDGVNDTWIVENVSNYPKANVMVYNRWGQILYNGNSMDDPWEGTLNGEVLPTGSYAYIVDLHDETDPFTGVVVIMY